MKMLERLPKVLARAGLGKSTVYKLISEGKFPRPVSIGARAIGFVSEEVDEWINSRVAARNQMFGYVSERTTSITHGRTS